MHRLRAFVFGALAFGLLHAAFVITWKWFDSAAQFSPWFLNRGSAVVLTIVVFLAVGATTAWWARGRPMTEALGDALVAACGASAAMVVALFTIAGGAGSIVPIVVVIGAGLLAASTAAGAFIALFARLGSRAPKP